MVAVELDALHPATLNDLAVAAIESQFDMSLFKEHQERERQDLKKLEAIKKEMMAKIKSMTSHTSDEEDEESD